LLASLQKNTGREVHIVGIDWCAEPLQVTKNLLVNGLENLPSSSEEFIDQMKAAWSSETITDTYWKIGNHLLVIDDLDFDGGRTFGDHPILSVLPSQWDKRLKASFSDYVPKEGFDIIITSFCLFHLNWWRSTLLRALSLLKQGGLFLNSYLDGDEHLFEGRTSNIRNISNEFKHNNQTTTAIFKQLFEEPSVVSYLQKPRFASASLPGEIAQMLEYLAEEGISCSQKCQYFINPQVKKAPLITLLREGGLSTFRQIVDHIGEVKYYRIIDEIEKNVSEHQPDSLILEMNWNVYRMNDREQFSSSSLVQKWLNDEIDCNFDHISNGTQLYDLQSSLTFSINTINTLSGDGLAEELAKILILRGLLNSSCLGGEISLIHENKKTNFLCFINPLHKKKET
jgi:hypothetical protein